MSQPLKKNTWNHRAANLIKSELKKQGMGYQALRDALGLIGIDKTTNNITVMINRGSFSFAFFLQCMSAIGVKQIHLD